MSSLCEGLFAGLLLGTALSLPLNAAPKLPVEEFARSAEMSNATMSPDGQRVAFVRDRFGHPVLHVLDLSTQQVTRFDFGPAKFANGATKDIGEFTWVGNRRLLVQTLVWGDYLYGTVAVDADATHATPLTGYEDTSDAPDEQRYFGHRIIHRFFDEHARVLVLEDHRQSLGTERRPDVLLIETDTGTTRKIVENDGDVDAWGIDGAGVVRLGMMADENANYARYRPDEKSPWRRIDTQTSGHGELQPVGFDTENNCVFVAGTNAQKRWTLFTLDPSSGKLSQPLLSDPEYDILPQEFIPTLDGNRLATPIFSPRPARLLGIRYLTDAPRVKWFDRDMQKYQAAVDRGAAGTTNILVDMSNDGKRMLWFGFSDQDPGEYYLADLDKHSFKLIGRRCSWIKPAEMAPMLAVKYQARDGLVIHGFLTVPAGLKPQNLPLIVMPHGGPWVRDFWHYDPFVQFLANRGYAVLQMNYRGSPGYGDELFSNARKQVGGQIQDDIEDATRWALAAGVADPKHIAIVGESYGGYSALFALGRSPGLYSCGVSIAGVADWPALFHHSDVVADDDAAKYWRTNIGDPTKDLERLRQASPVNFADKIVAPTLLIHGKDDRRVPLSQAKRMAAALEKSGHPAETLYLSGVGHSFGSETDTAAIYKAVETFLQAHLGPGVR